MWIIYYIKGGLNFYFINIRFLRIKVEKYFNYFNYLIILNFFIDYFFLI